jgi:hypothetical protein
MALGITDARKENLVSDGFWCTPDLTGPKKLGLGTVMPYYFGRLRFRIANCRVWGSFPTVIGWTGNQGRLGETPALFVL